MVSNYETDVALQGASPSSADWRHRIFTFDRRISEHTLTCRELLEDICSGHSRIHGHSHHRESGQTLVRIQRFRIVQRSHLDLSLTRALLRMYTVRDHRRISTPWSCKRSDFGSFFSRHQFLSIFGLRTLYILFPFVLF